ncbi:MAG: hypothetical protein AAB152_04390 [Candidatus Coatesbacteria bacterium]
MTARTDSGAGQGRGAWLALLGVAMLAASPVRAIKVTAVTVDLEPGGSGPWTIGITPATPIHTGDWIRVNLTLENDTGLIGNSVVDMGSSCPPVPYTCPPGPPTNTLTAFDPFDWVANNDGASGQWPGQYWVWPYAPPPSESCGYFPGSPSAPLSLVSADPIMTFAYNGYTYAPNAANDTETVSWVFRADLAACGVDLDIYAMDQDDFTGGWSHAPTEGSWRDAGCALTTDGSAHNVLAAAWGGTLCLLPPVSVTAAVVVTSTGTRPAGVAFVGDSVEIRVDATNGIASPVVVNPGQACLGLDAAPLTAPSVCPVSMDAKGGCLPGRTEAGSPVLPDTIPVGATHRFTWTETIMGANVCGAFGGCTAGGAGSGAASWTAVVASTATTAALTVQRGPIEITATVWVDPDGAGIVYGASPLGVIAPGSSEAGPFYYMGAETLETRFTYRNTSGYTFDITPAIMPSNVATEVDLVGGPTPAGALTLAPGASVSATWTWAKRPGGGLDGCTTATYDLEFTSAARGNCLTQSVQARDLPFHPYDVCAGGCSPPGSRALTFVVPANVNTGSDYPVVLHARNTDSRPFVFESPPGAVWISYTPSPGTATPVSSPPVPPPLYAWNPGETKSFTWTYHADTDGAVQYCAGIDFAAGSPPCHGACLETPPYCGSSFGFVQQSTPGALEITSFAASSAVAVAGLDGAFNLQMNLRNNGADCLRVIGFCSLGYPDVQPTGNAWDAASPPAPSASPNPAVPFIIQPGATQLVTWYMTANCPDATSGAISFACGSSMVKAESIDCVTKAVITPSVVADWTGPPLPPVQMTSAAYLSASIWTDQAQYSMGQVVTVFLSVSNSGGNDVTALGITMTPNTFAGAAVVAVAGPVPAVPATYPGSGQCTSPEPYNSRTTFVWNYTVAAAGFVSFTAKAVGTDGISGLDVGTTATTSKAGLSTGSGLECAILAPPVDVVTMTATCAGCPAVSNCDSTTGNGCLDIVMAASNLGGIDLVNATVSQGTAVLKSCAPGSCAAPGVFPATACPAPTCEPAEATVPGTIPAGSTRNYTWRYDPAGLGCVRALAQVSGFDGATGAPLLQSAWGPCVEILPRWPVELTLLSAPPQIAPGQRFEIPVRACNPGMTPVALQGGQPALQFSLGGAAVTDQYDTDPPPSGTIAVGGCRDLAIGVVARRDATPGVVTIRVPQGSQYVAMDATTGLPVTALDGGGALTIRVSDPRSRLFVTGEHPVHILRDPALLEYVLADAGRGNGRLTLRIYTLTGEMVRSLVDKPAVIEDCVVPWDGRNAAGQLCAGGVYLARLEAPGFSTTAKVAIVK